MSTLTQKELKMELAGDGLPTSENDHYLRRLGAHKLILTAVRPRLRAFFCKIPAHRFGNYR